MQHSMHSLLVEVQMNAGYKHATNTKQQPGEKDYRHKKLNFRKHYITGGSCGGKSLYMHSVSLSCSVFSNGLGYVAFHKERENITIIFI